MPHVAALGPANSHFDADQWLVRASAILGESHRRREAACQDAFCAWSEGRRCIAVVADGAGSASHGGEGAERAARAVVTRLALSGAGAPARKAIVAALSDTRQDLADQAGLDGLPLKSYAATLVGMVMNGSRGLFFHLGDGLALGFDAGSPPKVTAISRGTPSEFANVASFLVDADWQANLVYTPIWSSTAALLMTDGFAPFATGSDQQPKPRFYEPILGFLAAHPAEVGAQALADLMDREVVRRTSGDDCTLLWAARRADR